jgi:hypothetical protein
VVLTRLWTGWSFCCSDSRRAGPTEEKAQHDTIDCSRIEKALQGVVGGQGVLFWFRTGRRRKQRCIIGTYINKYLHRQATGLKAMDRPFSVLSMSYCRRWLVLGSAKRWAQLARYPGSLGTRLAAWPSNNSLRWYVGWQGGRWPAREP